MSAYAAQAQAHITYPYKEEQKMAYKLSDFPNVKGQVATVLKSLGIADTDQLLMLVTDPAQRASLLQQLGVDERLLNDLIEQTDLTRVKGIGPSFAVLLTNAGIRSVPQMAQANSAELHDKLTKTAATMGAQRIPREDELAQWIATAKQTPDLVSWSTAERVSATKALFAGDEWTKISLAPLAAASLVMLASPSKGKDATAEANAAVAAIEGAQKGTAAWSLLNVAFAKGVTVADLQKFINETPPAALTSTIQAAAAAVVAKAPDEAAAYKAMLMQVATGVAEASKEGGFLGIGKKVVSDEEQAALNNLKSALGL
jgi:hypothetical protein